MAKKYGVIRQAKPQFPIRGLLVVPHQDGDLIVSYPFFGSSWFKDNVSNMGKTYSHPQTEEAITFREPTTSESISALAYDFKDMKKKVLDHHWLQAGRIVRASDGVYANTDITNEAELRKLRAKAKKVNGVWILDNGIVKGVRDFGFADYGSFDRQTTGISCKDFAKSGLARILEHTKGEIAENLRKIASPDNYRFGVSVLGFDDVKKPTAGFVELYSYRYDSHNPKGRLCVSGNWDDNDVGYVPGVLVSTA